MSRVHTCVVTSDVHFDQQHKPTVSAVTKLIKDVQPGLLVINGDFVDFGSISRWEPDMDHEVRVIVQLKAAVDWINEISPFCGHVIIVAGNHDQRWDKALRKAHGPKFKGALGLDLWTQMRLQGLQEAKIQYFEESPDTQGLFIGPVCFLHGHNAKKGAIATLRMHPHYNTVIGHWHKAELACHTSFDKMRWCLSMPNMARVENFCVAPDWQRGCAVIDFYGGDRFTTCPNAQPYIVLSQADYSLTFARKVYKP